MIERIEKNEERLERSLSCIHHLEEALGEFEKVKKEVSLLNRYYGSKNWFHDKEAYETGKIPSIKAGVLSEDAVWNMNEELVELIREMKRIVKNSQRK